MCMKNLKWGRKDFNNREMVFLNFYSEWHISYQMTMKEDLSWQHTDPLDKIKNYYSHFKYRKTEAFLRCHPVTDNFSDNQPNYLAMQSNYMKIQFWP